MPMRVEHADLVVVGAGPAGLSAATEAARAGVRVIVVDESPVPGGCLRFELQELFGPGDHVEWQVGVEEAHHLACAAEAAGVCVIPGASVWGIFPGWEVYVTPVDPASAVPDVIRAPALIVATGAAQNPMVLPGWTLPGVLNAGAAQFLLNVYRIRPGTRAVVVGIDPLALVVARQLTFGGVEVKAILPPAPGPYVIGSFQPDAVTRSLDDSLPVWGIPLLLRRAVMSIEGRDRVEGVRVVDLDADGHIIPGGEETWEVDAAVTVAGLFPLVNLILSVGCPVVHIPELGGHVPLYGPDLETPLSGLFVAGSLTGVVGSPIAAAQGRLAGITAARHLGKLQAGRAAQEQERIRASLSEARARAFEFLPDADRGMARLAGLWDRRAT